MTASEAFPEQTEVAQSNHLVYVDAANGFINVPISEMVESDNVTDMVGVRVADLAQAVRGLNDPNAMIYFKSNHVARNISPVDGDTLCYTFADERVKVFTKDREVEIDGENVHFMPLSYKIIEVLARHKGIVVSRRDVLKSVWGHNLPQNSNMLDVYMGYVRKSLGVQLGDPKSGAIRSIRNVGFKAVTSLEQRNDN